MRPGYSSGCQFPFVLKDCKTQGPPEGFFDFALNFVDPAKAHPVGDFRRKKEIVRTRFPEGKGSGRCAENDNVIEESH